MPMLRCYTLICLISADLCDLALNKAELLFTGTLLSLEVLQRILCRMQASEANVKVSQFLIVKLLKS